MNIKELREILVELGKTREKADLEKIKAGLRELVEAGHRCSIVDFDRNEVLCSARIVGYEHGKVKVMIEELVDPSIEKVRELPIEKVQELPLSHLVDPDEGHDPEQIVRIYEGMKGFIKTRGVILAESDGKNERSASDGRGSEEVLDSDEVVLEGATGEDRRAIAPDDKAVGAEIRHRKSGMQAGGPLKGRTVRKAQSRHARKRRPSGRRGRRRKKRGLLVDLISFLLDWIFERIKRGLTGVAKLVRLKRAENLDVRIQKSTGRSDGPEIE